VLRLRVPSILIWPTSFFRCLPLFFSARPKTPLRVLGVMTFDALHRLRRSTPLPVTRLKAVAALLDFSGCSNAMFDNKDYCRNEIRLTRQILDDAGLEMLVEEFLRRLSDLERKRPPALEGDSQFHAVMSYREAVIRLLLGAVATTALGKHNIEEGIRATYSDDDLQILFRIVMQLQIIDDVLDYSNDMSAGLPSFLTASESLPEEIKRTDQAAIGYANTRDLAYVSDAFPLRIALFLASTGAKTMTRLIRWRFGCLKSEHFLVHKQK